MNSFHVILKSTCIGWVYEVVDMYIFYSYSLLEKLNQITRNAKQVFSGRNRQRFIPVYFFQIAD